MRVNILFCLFLDWAFLTTNTYLKAHFAISPLTLEQSQNLSMNPVIIPWSGPCLTTLTFHLHKMNYCSHRRLGSLILRSVWKFLFLQNAQSSSSSPGKMHSLRHICSSQLQVPALCCVEDTHWSDGYPPLATPGWHSTLSCPPCPVSLTYSDFISSRLSPGMWLDFSRGRHQWKIFRAKKSGVVYLRL